MKQYFLAFCLFSTILVFGQTSADAPIAEAGNKGYAWAGQRNFDKEKNYIVFRLWNEKMPIAEDEKKELDLLTQQLAKKNVTLVNASFTNQQDLEALFKKHGIDVNANVDQGIKLETSNSNYSISANTGYFIFEEKKPVSVCSGLKCIESLKRYFKLIVKA